MQFRQPDRTMKTKDYLIVALAPLSVLTIPLVGVLVSEEWKWTFFDFAVAWVILAGTTFAFRFLATRQVANFAYRAGAGLAVAAGFLITWVSLAVQIIGDDNPGNLLYFLVILGGIIGVGVARFQPTGLARLAFGMAATLLLIPVISVLAWPADFNPGFPKVFLLNSFFVALFAGSGLLFRHAARQSPGSAAATMA
jgi:hypothetical protein